MTGSALELLLVVSLAVPTMALQGSSSSGSHHTTVRVGVAPSNESRGAKVGQVIPAFTGLTPEGRMLSSRDWIAANRRAWRNSSTVMFFATWCHACATEIRATRRKSKDSGGGEGFGLLFIHVGPAVQDVREWLRLKGFDRAVVLLDPQGRLAARLGTTLLPTAITVDGDGRVLGIYQGATPPMGTGGPPALRSRRP